LGSLNYVVESADSCAHAAGWSPVRERNLLDPKLSERYVLISADRGRSMNLPGLVDSLCYDYLSGSSHVVAGASLVGFGIAPVKDLTEDRNDRISLLLLSGPSAEIFFD
jgi:hypothetical protein